MTDRANGGVTGASVVNSGSTTPTTETFNSDGTWTRAQSAIATVDVVVLGGGGGGMGDSGSGGGG